MSPYVQKKGSRIFRFREDIQILSSKNLTPRTVSLRGVETTAIVCSVARNIFSYHYHYITT